MSSYRISDVVKKTKNKFARQKAGTTFWSFAALLSDWDKAVYPAARANGPSAESDHEKENRAKENTDE